MRLSSHALPLLLGIALTLTLRGYQFGGGNHTVYMIAPLREVHPELLANDWWTTNTLQYHLAYTKLTATVMRLGVHEPAFMAFYLALVVLLHAAWLRIAVALGLTARHYLLSVLLYYLSAGGTALGSYQFLQDSSFLPGNVANVALLWGIAFWIDRRAWPAAVCLALAALWHLNHAIIALAFSLAAFLFQRWHGRLARERSDLHGRDARPTSKAVLGFLLILIFALPNLIPAARLTLARLPKMPLGEFVDLYVHLRHPHHYDPLAWPLALWLSFLWPIPLAVIAYRRSRDSSVAVQHARAAFAVLFFLVLLLIAFVFAGVVFVSEPLIQMSLFRFSLYPKVLTCVGAAAFLLDPTVFARRAVRTALIALPAVAVLGLLVIRLARPGSTAGLFVQANLPTLLLFVALLAGGIVYVLRSHGVLNRHSSALVVLLLAVLLLGWNRWLGLQIALNDGGDQDYRALCRFARDNTPVDAVFLVPPNEQLFRYHARRAVVANFKNVPQLSSEMTEWKRRLEVILDRPLTALPKRFDLTHDAIAARYDVLPFEHLAGVAARYNARYVVTAKPQGGRKPVFETGRYHLYDLAHVR
jgi:hypothetical protein